MRERLAPPPMDFCDCFLREASTKRTDPRARSEKTKNGFFLGGQKPAFCVLFCFSASRPATPLRPWSVMYSRWWGLGSGRWWDGVSPIGALRGGLWRRGLSVVKRSSCAAGRSVAAAFLPISKPRAALRVPGRSVAAAFLPISKPRALWGGLWRQARRPSRSSCAAGRSVAAGAVCGEKK